MDPMNDIFCLKCINLCSVVSDNTIRQICYPLAVHKHQNKAIIMLVSVSQLPEHKALFYFILFVHSLFTKQI